MASYGGPQGILAPSFDPAERAGGVTALEGEWNLLKQQLHPPELAAAPRQDSHRGGAAPAAETQAEPEAVEAADEGVPPEGVSDGRTEEPEHTTCAPAVAM
eukprot:COSAG01_NODE_1911_length_8925_cov_151.747111_8_plen_101_part_00